MGFAAFCILTIAIVVPSVAAAQRLAFRKHRSPGPWMWAAAFLGPVPLAVLVFLPALSA